MTQVKTTLGEGGRLVIPAEHRKALGLKPGDCVVVSLQDRELRIRGLDESVRRAQALVARHLKPSRGGRQLSNKLIAERRREAKRD